MNIADCTVTEKILLASFQLEKDGQSPFSAESLIVGCWQKFPRTFGLKGYADLYPDSNKVLSSIMGERGMARRGWLSKMGQKMYALTREGRSVAERLATGGEPVTPVFSDKMMRDQEKFLLALFDASAVDKFDQNRKPELNFSDACKFWGISETANGVQLDTRMNHFRAQFAELVHFVDNGDIELSNGRSISKEDLSHLNEVHDYLEERFARHINLLRTRTERV